jgi:hypothetical protein
MADALKEMAKEYAKAFVPVSTRVDRSRQITEIKTRPDVLKEKTKEIETKLAELQIQTSVGTIKTALDAVAKYVEITKYKSESGSLRTDTTEEALEFMDCTEFAARFLQIACQLDKVPAFSSSILATTFDEKNDYGGFLKYVEESGTKDFTDIQPGDVFIWYQAAKEDEKGNKTKAKGHVGVVVSYDQENDRVHILESLTQGAERSLNGGKNELTNQVRHSVYTRTGKALSAHEGWRGYFRPIIKTK